MPAPLAERKLISLQVRGVLGQAALQPQNLDIATLRKLLVEVERLLLVARRRATPPVSLVSYGGDRVLLSFEVPDGLADSLLDDLRMLQMDPRLDGMKHARAKQLQAWQAQVRENPGWSYAITSPELDRPFVIDSGSHFVYQEVFVEIELYLYGTVLRMGGRHNARIHLRDERYGLKVVRCKRTLLEGEKQNRLYKFCGSQVRARLNTLTGKTDRYELIRFVDIKTQYNKTDLSASIRQATPTLRGLGRGWLRQAREATP